LSLEITQRETNGVYLLSLRGRLALGDESAGFRSTIDQLLAAGATRILVNLEHVHYADSAGLGALIEARRKITAKGARLRLSNLGPNFRRALEIARLLDLFDSHPTESAALTNF
jgi:anti-anti-sigma factor